MSGKATSEANFGRKTEDTSSNVASTGTGAYQKQATFDPRADELISSLGGSLRGSGQDGNTASSYLSSLLEKPGGVNPYAQQVVDSQNQLANADFDKRLAGVRSGGYGGGIGRDLIDQGMFTSDYTDRQYASNAKTLLDAFQQQQGNQLTAAGQLQGADATKYAAALNLINTLRGESGVNEQNSNTDTVARGVTKTQDYNNQISAGFKI